MKVTENFKLFLNGKEVTEQEIRGCKESMSVTVDNLSVFYSFSPKIEEPFNLYKSPKRLLKFTYNRPKPMDIKPYEFFSVSLYLTYGIDNIKLAEKIYNDGKKDNLTLEYVLENYSYFLTAKDYTNIEIWKKEKEAKNSAKKLKENLEKLKGKVIFKEVSKGIYAYVETYLPVVDYEQIVKDKMKLAEKFKQEEFDKLNILDIKSTVSQGGYAKTEDIFNEIQEKNEIINYKINTRYDLSLQFSKEDIGKIVHAKSIAEINAVVSEVRNQETAEKEIRTENKIMLKFKSISEHNIIGRGKVFCVEAQSDKNLLGETVIIDDNKYEVTGIEIMGVRSIKAGDKLGLLVRKIAEKEIKKDILKNQLSKNTKEKIKSFQSTIKYKNGTFTYGNKTKENKKSKGSFLDFIDRAIEAIDKDNFNQSSSVNFIYDYPISAEKDKTEKLNFTTLEKELNSEKQQGHLSTRQKKQQI